MSDHKRTGITIGAGHFAAIQLDAWQRVHGAKIVGIISRTAEHANNLAEKFGIGYSGTNIEQAIEQLHPDFIDICTPPSSHLHYVQIAVNSGLPILCQKPIAPTQEESRQVVQLCARRKIPLMINENWRWQPWYQETKHLLDDGVLGEILHVDATMRPGDGWGDQPYPDQPYFKDMKRFLLFETGVHYFETLQFLFGPIQRVYCRSRTINQVIQGEDYVVVLLEFASGLVGIYDANRVAYTEKVRSESYGWIRIEGTKANLRIDFDGRVFVQTRNGKEVEHEFVKGSGWKGGAAVSTQQHFVDCLTNNKPFVTNGPTYLQTQEVVFACYLSAQEGIPIEVPKPVSFTE
ncbi:Gfo/Idh/MocA family oxidoreductase [Alicyclobacillus tolerans]|uniref:Gfo/Idh/MocA family protein n=1 Tax=Alicyclobacillus tolerans TaxID=90970 RepID=UPI001F179F4C|nr:Gfo/Idh/MocA family oxidoreductase [Alicyclobacillus tolerans]MCF8565156.1 Gfo/Idh/MocA family oxidoreductase [Alicyclobacillus tolerans]